MCELFYNTLLIRFPIHLPSKVRLNTLRTRTHCGLMFPQNEYDRVVYTRNSPYEYRVICRDSYVSTFPTGKRILRPLLTDFSRVKYLLDGLNLEQVYKYCLLYRNHQRSLVTGERR